MSLENSVAGHNDLSATIPSNELKLAKICSAVFKDESTLDANTLIYKYQFGFREEHSTHRVLIYLTGNISKALDDDDRVIGVFLDMK